MTVPQVGSARVPLCVPCSTGCFARRGRRAIIAVDDALMEPTIGLFETDHIGPHPRVNARSKK